jgi:hypothetical protein
MKIPFLLLSICTGLFGCSKDETIPLGPIARFETEKTHYDVGEVIQFINTSENSSSFSWSFGNSKFSNEPNPEFSMDLKSVLGYKFTATLKSYSDDGLQDSVSHVLFIGKRILSNIHILRMEKSIEEKIAKKDGQDFNMITYMGPITEPLEWIKPEQTIPESKLNIDSGYPKEIHLMKSWPIIAMNNKLWFIRFSVQPAENGADKRIFLKEFRFNPCQTDFVVKENGVRQFLLEDEEMAVAIDFRYLD